MKVFVGYDPRELTAYRVCIDSIRRHSGIVGLPINSRMLGSLYSRPEEIRNGILWDLVSNAPMATEFSIARFYIPQIVRSGWVVFCDGDFLWRSDLRELFSLQDDRYAVRVVKHNHLAVEGETKMDGQIQTTYPRKNWSSLMLLNCSAPEVRALTATILNSATGRYLHGFDWVADERIGDLPLSWNWLAGISDKSVSPNAVHFTLGTPDMAGYEDSPYASEWRAYASR